MNPQVTAAVISGGVALAVALLGIAGAIAAQLMATRRGFNNSLELLRQQRSDEEQARREQFLREDAYRFAAERRTTYARFLQLALDLGNASRAADDANDKHSRAEAEYQARAAQEDRGEIVLAYPGSAERKRWAEELSQELQQHLDARGLACSTVRTVFGEVQLLASAEVRHAAEQLWRAANWSFYPGELAPPGLGQQDRNEHYHRAYNAAHTAFLEATRRELGVAADE
jgi:type II secretory pathway pseudopilin PulG